MDEFGSSGELGMSEPVDGDIYEDWSDIDTSHLVSDEDGAAPEADEAEADEADQPENADGVRGHLETVGVTEHRPGLYERVFKRVLDVLLEGLPADVSGLLGRFLAFCHC